MRGERGVYGCVGMSEKENLYGGKGKEESWVLRGIEEAKYACYEDST